MGYKNTFVCKHCETEVTRMNATQFCSIKCQAGYRWNTKTKPNVLSGGISDVKTKKRALIEERGEVCEVCSIEAVWNNKPLSLQVGHIDGDSDNNEFSNLRLICPNCHTQTETFGAKGKGSRYKKLTKRNKYLREYKARMV